MNQLTLQLQVQVLVFPTQEGHVAQCVNFDFAAQGRTVEETLARFHKAFVGQIITDVKAKRLPFSTFKPTPVRYQLMFEKAWLRYGAMGPLQLPPNLPQLEGQPPLVPPNVTDVRVWAAQWAA